VRVHRDSNAIRQERLRRKGRRRAKKDIDHLPPGAVGNVRLTPMPEPYAHLAIGRNLKFAVIEFSTAPALDIGTLDDVTNND
jgi:hypothetical protein